jgi:DNA invertase Pin-like site-specific DNA recombinase/uncharacterized ParB-like nuclease family protein
MSRQAKTKALIKAVIYARYSSHNQREVSIEQQVDECREYAEKNGITVTHIYSDKHLSGRKDARPDFHRMIRDAQSHAFQMMIAWKSNRAFRNMKDAMNYEEKLMHHGVRCVYIKEDFSDTAAGRFAKRTMMNVNQFYSENMAEDIMRGMSDNAEKNLVNCKPPLGYKRGEDGRFAIDEPSARVVQEIFRRFAGGETLAVIARDLNARGIKTSRNGPWGKNSFHVLLKNERYTGVYIWGDVRTPGGMPKIIEREVFDEVQRMMKTSKAIKGRKGPNADYMLTGKLFCGYCKSPMVGVSGTSASGQPYYYYSCNKARDKGCHKKNAARDWTERTIAAAVVDYVLQDHIIEWVAENTVKYYEKRKEWSRVQEIEHRLKDVNKAIDNLMAAILQGILTDTTKGKMIELEEEKSLLAEQLRVEKRALPDITKEKVIFWLESFKDQDVSSKKFQRVLFDNFLSAAYLFDDELRLVYDYTGTANEVIVPLDKEKADKAVDADNPSCSYSGSYGPPNEANTNKAVIYMVDSMFVLALRLEEKVIG